MIFSFEISCKYNINYHSPNHYEYFRFLFLAFATVFKIKYNPSWYKADTRKKSIKNNKWLRQGLLRMCQTRMNELNVT